MRRLLPALAAILTLPSIASAQSLGQLAGLMNIFVGLMLVAAFLTMGTGAAMWMLRLGTANTYRDEAITVMQWGVSILFVLILLTFVVQFVQEHTAETMFVLGVAFLGLIVWFATTVAKSGGEEEEH